MNVYPIKSNYNTVINQQASNKKVQFKNSSNLVKNIGVHTAGTFFDNSYSKILNFKNFIKSIINKININPKQLPVVESALLAYFIGLQKESDFYKEITERDLKNEYVTSGQKKTASILQELEAKQVIKPEQAYESPRFYNGVLTDNAYNDIIQKVKDAPAYLLNDYQKKEIINSLASSNYHSEDIILSNVHFKGNIDRTSSNVNIDNMDSREDITDIDDDGSILDAVLDFLDDLF